MYSGLRGMPKRGQLPQPGDRGRAAGATRPELPHELQGATLDADGQQLAILSFRIPDGPEGARLTAAEREVVAALLAGKSNAEIAKARETSTRTVANQVASIFRKLDVHSRAQLVAYCEVIPTR